MKRDMGTTNLTASQSSHRAAVIGCAATLLVIVASVVQAQTIPSDIESLENSEGAGMASYADLNGYPGPKHILDMQEKLNLSEEQLKDVQSIFEAMKENAQAKGEAIIAKEVELEQLFRLGKATESEAKTLSRTIGTLRGELRAVHLTAHVQAKQVLTKEQVTTYNSIRNNMRQPKHGH
jgi:Spy/CpxP family protein refolding chaperone